ncbi:hypothetical protein GDO78_020482 [Eleutherodactylus coqui]|uniref:Uncharacterized protein n=1 Tax=Eleutherodactylus coqui TaxID=57060 RepID=A0A8J6EI77_ELECQ|nr:hypothetical protein GDO78_020482 [Eleutherodactylus coqui]
MVNSQQNLLTIVPVPHNGPADARKDAPLKAVMMSTLERGRVAPWFSVAAASFVQFCMIFAVKQQGRSKFATPHLPRPLYPFQGLQIGYTQLPLVGQHEYVLVVVNVFQVGDLPC